MFCMRCGKEFIGNARYCKRCKAEKKKEYSNKMNIYVKERNKKLGLTNIAIYKEDRDFLKKLRGEKRLPIADIVKEIINKYIDINK